MKTYDLNPTTQATLDKAFFTHPLSDDQTQRLEAIDEKLRQFATQLSRLTPGCPEQTLMIRSIQEAGHWAREAITKNEHGK